MTTAEAPAAVIASIATHNGYITITNPLTGDHRTIRIATQAKDATFAPGERIVALLSGPDNTNDYEQFGFVRNGRVIVWHKKRGGAFDAYANVLNHPKWFQENRGLTYQFDTRCRRCNRQLTTPESIESGIGPICRGLE